MKIKTRFLLGLSSKPILLLLLIGIGWFQISTLNQLNTMAQKNFELSLLAETIQRGVKDEAISLRNIVIFQEEESIYQELGHLETVADSVSQNISLLESKVTTEEQINMVENLKKLNRDFIVYKERIKQLVADGHKQEAVNIINQNGHNLHAEFLDVITHISNHFQANMKRSFEDTTGDFERNIWITTIISLVSVLLSASFVIRTVWSVANRLSKVSTTMSKVVNGDKDSSIRIEVQSNDEIDEVAKSFNKMIDSLNEQRILEKNMTWIKSNVADITTSLTGIHDLGRLSHLFLSKIVPLMDASHALIYVKDLNEKSMEPIYKLFSSYAYLERENDIKSFKPGEGLVGQAILEKAPMMITEVPSDYIRIQSGLGGSEPLTLYIIPISFEGEVKAVIELASFKAFTSLQQSLIEELSKGLGIILESVLGRMRLSDLLEETQTLMEEIQAQSEELQSQQEELRIANEELETQTQTLRKSEEMLQVQQEELEQTNFELMEKARSLEEQNKRFEETNREVEKARAELEEKAKQLTLISTYKSEFLANMSHELRTPLNSLLILSKLLADNKEGNLTAKQVQYSNTIYSSGKDLLALINDILDLAKIESGKMDVHPSRVRITHLKDVLEDRFRPIAEERNLSFGIFIKEDVPDTLYSDEKRILQVLENLLSNAIKFTQKGGVNVEISRMEERVHFAIRDTGIGIPLEKQELIFQAFQQADGTTSRKYGGTGLGLSICREISTLLGGQIAVDSEEGLGSTFHFLVGDYLLEGSNLITDTVIHLDEVAVTKEVTNIALERETNNSLPIETVHFQNEHDIMRLLIVDDDKQQRNSLMELIGDMDIIIKAVATGKEAMEELKVNQFDFLLLDLGLNDMSGFDLLKKVKSSNLYDQTIVLIYTGRELTSKEEFELNKYAHTIIVKDEFSIERLKDELELCIKSKTKIESEMKGVNRKKKSHDLEGLKVLLVDDDVRNVYALSNFLEIYGMDITFAENGLECLDVLEGHSTFDLILMDIMMPEMDGYETIQRLRAMPEYDKMPIIALTAKAMTEDRERCMEAGASDYIVKPFQPEQLLSLIRVWAYPQEGNLK
jgi:two-component system, chemotaxis family, sensor kinase CheA